jgi:hypothetical protein
MALEVYDTTPLNEKPSSISSPIDESGLPNEPKSSAQAALDSMREYKTPEGEKGYTTDMNNDEYIEIKPKKGFIKKTISVFLDDKDQEKIGKAVKDTSLYGKEIYGTSDSKNLFGAFQSKGAKTPQADSDLIQSYINKKVSTNVKLPKLTDKDGRPLSEEDQKSAMVGYYSRKKRYEEIYRKEYEQDTPRDKMLLAAKLAKSRDKESETIREFAKKERIRNEPLNKAKKWVDQKIKDSGKGSFEKIIRLGSGKKEGLVLSAQNLGVGHTSNPMNNPTLHYQPAPVYNRPVQLAPVTQMSPVSQAPIPQMSYASQRPMMPSHISSISQSPEITPMTAQPVTSSDQIGFMIARPDSGPGLREPVGMQAPSYTEPDIPQHKLQAPAYVASNPFAAPPEFPPFGDNPMRNYTMSNVDHPLFEKNVPKQPKFIW